MMSLLRNGRYCNQYPWLLMPKNLGRQAKSISVWYPKEGADLKMIHDDELVVVRDFLRMLKHAYLHIRN